MLEVTYIPYDFRAKKYLVPNDLVGESVTEVLGKLLVLGAKEEQPTVGIRLEIVGEEVKVFIVRAIGCNVKCESLEAGLSLSTYETVGGLMKVVGETLYLCESLNWFERGDVLDKLYNSMAKSLGITRAGMNKILPQMCLELTVALNEIKYEQLETITPIVGNLKALLFLTQLKYEDLDLLTIEWYDGMPLKPIVERMLQRVKFSGRPYEFIVAGQLQTPVGSNYSIHKDCSHCERTNDTFIHYQFSCAQNPSEILGYALVSGLLDGKLQEDLDATGHGCLGRELNNGTNVVLHELVVHEPHRGKGVAKDILIHLVEKVKAEDKGALVLQAHPLEFNSENEVEAAKQMYALRGLYDRLGFEVLLEQNITGRPLPIVIYYKSVYDRILRSNKITTSSVFQ